MDTRMVTNEVRMANWAAIIKARSESGLTIKDYCKEHGISREAYFYWQRKLRESAIKAAGGQFVELAVPAKPHAAAECTGGVTIDLNGVKIQVEDAGCRNTLAMVLEVLRNAQ